MLYLLAKNSIDGCCCGRRTKVDQRDLCSGSSASRYAQELLDGLDKLDGWPEKVRTHAAQLDRRARERTSILPGRARWKTEMRNPTSQRRRIGLHREWTPSSVRPACNLLRNTRWWPFTAADAKLKAQVDDLSISRRRRARLAIWARLKSTAFPPPLCHQPLQRPARCPSGGQLHLADYGTGAIMSVPGTMTRLEFATKYGLPITRVIKPVGKAEGAELPFFPKTASGKFRRIQRLDAKKRRRNQRLS